MVQKLATKVEGVDMIWLNGPLTLFCEQADDTEYQVSSQSSQNDASVLYTEGAKSYPCLHGLSVHN